MLDAVPHNRPWIDQSDCEAILATIRSGQLAQGAAVDTLEQSFVTLMGVGEACAVSSGSAALFLALKANGIGSGDDVVVPSYTCHALLDAVRLCSARPCVVDVDENFHLSLESIAATPATRNARAVVSVHTFGKRAPVNELRKYCPNALIIEDCCHSLGTMHDGKFHGGGDVSIYSFYPTKVVAGGEAGLVWSKNGELIRRIRSIISVQPSKDRQFQFNFRSSDLEAAVVANQLIRLNEIRQRRHGICTRYATSCATVGLRPWLSEWDPQQLHYRFVLRTRNETETERLHRHFLSGGICSSRLFKPEELLHRLSSLQVSAFPNAEQCCRTTLSLPCFPSLSASEESRVLEMILKL